MRNIYCKMRNNLKYTLFSALWIGLLLVAPQLTGQNIQLSFTSVPPSCQGYTDGTVTVNATGGTIPYTYHWDNGQSGQTNFAGAAGSYSVTVTDQSGQTATGTTTLSEPALVVAAITPSGISCATTGGTLTGSATGGTLPYTYNWTGGGTTAAITANTVGAYIVTVTDAHGCSDLESYFVYAPLSLSIEVENIPCFMFCDGVARAVVTGGVYPYTYLWNTGATTQQISALPPGWYAVTVTDAAGCVKMDSAYIYEPPAISFTFSTIVPACGGNTGSVTAQASGGTPPFTYLWNYLNTTGPTLSNVPAGTYFVRAIDANGCQKDSSVVIPAGPGLNVTLSIQKASCQGVNDGTVTAIVTPATGNYSYQWNIQGANTASLNGIAAGTAVCVTVTDINTGCQGIACDVVGTHTVIGLQVTDTDVNCLADQTGTATALAFNGTEPYNYVWTYPNSSTVNGPFISGLGTGAYSVKVTDNQGCTAIGVADIGVLSTLTAAYELSVVECIGSAVKVQFTDKSTDSTSTIVGWSWKISWGSGMVVSTDQNPLAINFPSGETGTVQLTVTSAAGCTAFVSGPFTVDSLPNVYIDVDSPAFNCDNSPVHINVTGDPNYTYTWFPNTFLTPNPTLQNVILDPPQTQIYTLVAGNGSCIDTVQVEVIRHTPLAISVGTNNLVVCSSSATLHVNVNVSATVQWFNQLDSLIGTVADITVPATLQPTQYTVVATDALGCTQTDSVMVTGKEVSFSLNVPAVVVNCENLPIPINVTGAPAYTYTWSPMTGLTPTMNFPNVIANPTETTTYVLVGTNGFCSDTAQVKVIRVVPIDLALADTTTLTCLENKDLLVTFNLASNANIVWTSNPPGFSGNGPSVTVPVTAVPVVYTAVATDLHGCSQSVTAAVSGHPASVDIIANTPTTLCENLPVSLTAVNLNPLDTLTYHWTSVPNMNIPEPDEATVTITGMAGTYQIIVEAVNQFGCRDAEQMEITFLPAGSLAGQINIQNCGGLTVGFNNLTTIPGTWNFGDNQTSLENDPSHTYTAPNQYQVTFTPLNADCIAPFDTTVNVQGGSVIAPDITSNLLNCTDVAVYNLVSQPAGNGYNFQWTVGGQTSTEQSPTFTFNQTGTLTAYLTVTDPVTGCAGTDSLPLNVQFIDDKIGGDTAVCTGIGVQLNPSFNPAYTYLWTASPADATLVDPNNPNPTVHPTVTTTYTVLISNGPCTVEYTRIVTPQGSVILNLGSDQVVCNDNPVTLAVQNPVGNNYQWSQSSNFNIIIGEGSSIQIIPENDGIYYVRTGGNGDCLGQGQVKVDNAKVLVEAQPLDRNICFGESTELTITNLNPADNLQYTWSPALDSIYNPTVTPTSATAYSVIITNLSSNPVGCADTLNFNVNVTSLAVTAEVTGKDTICPGQSTTLQATAVGSGTVFTYAWTPAETLTGANTAKPTAHPDAQTTYTVTATADGFCPQTASVTVFFMGDQCLEPSIFVPKAFTPNSDGNNDLFIVRGVNIKELYMVVWDRWGEKVYETNDTQALGWDGTYQGASLTPDAYAWYVKATCGNGAVYEKKGNVTLLK